MSGQELSEQTRGVVFKNKDMGICPADKAELKMLSSCIMGNVGSLVVVFFQVLPILKALTKRRAMLVDTA